MSFVSPSSSSWCQAPPPTYSYVSSTSGAPPVRSICWTWVTTYLWNQSGLGEVAPSGDQYWG
ncbi:hypothetical protein [Nonomuraea salmonea]|uniref:hypothetical protein n=1 Tax=Nonomuraea salmonea TaxID=46181 RepID=UPI0031F0A415